MRFSDAVDQMKKGARARHADWGPTDPSFVVFIAGRVVEASFPPMVDHLGQGTEFLSVDHIDAVWATVQGDKIVGAQVQVGYQFSQNELLNDSWEIL